MEMVKVKPERRIASLCGRYWVTLGLRCDFHFLSPHSRFLRWVVALRPLVSHHPKPTDGRCQSQEGGRSTRIFVCRILMTGSANFGHACRSLLHFPAFQASFSLKYNLMGGKQWQPHAVVITSHFSALTSLKKDECTDDRVTYGLYFSATTSFLSGIVSVYPVSSYFLSISTLSLLPFSCYGKILETIRKCCLSRNSFNKMDEKRVHCVSCRIVMAGLEIGNPFLSNPFPTIAFIMIAFVLLYKENILPQHLPGIIHNEPMKIVDSWVWRHHDCQEIGDGAHSFSHWPFWLSNLRWILSDSNEKCLQTLSLMFPIESFKDQFYWPTKRSLIFSPLSFHSHHHKQPRKLRNPS